MLPFNPKDAEELRPEKLGGLLWKQSPSPYAFGMHQRRYVELSSGQLSWSLIDGDSKPGQRKGFLDFTGNSCTVEPVAGSDVKFVLRPTGSCWGIGGSFTGSNGGTRILQFDATDSAHERQRWIKAIQAHMRWGENRCEPPPALKEENDVKSERKASALKKGNVKTGKKAKGVKLSLQEDVEMLDAASEGSPGPKRNIRERINTGFAFSDAKSESDATSTGFERNGDGPKANICVDVEEFEAASEATDGPKRDVRSRMNTGYAREEAERSPMKFSDNVEELDAASEGTGGPKRDVRDRMGTGFEKEVKAQEIEETNSKPKPLKFADDSEVLDAASEAPETTRSVRTRIATGYNKNGDAPSEDRHTSRPMKFSENVEELEAASEASTTRHRSVRERINTGFSKFVDPEDEGAAPQDETKGGKNIQFIQAENVDAASEATSGRARNVRNRILTGFTAGTDEQGGESDSDHDESAEMSFGKRQSMLQGRLSINRGRRQSARRSSISAVNRFKASEKREMQHAVVGIGPAVLADDSPEATLEDHLVEAEHDAVLLKISLSGLVLFEDAEEQAIQDLIQAMRVFAFEDKEEVVRQGDLGGTYFFVVAQGQFEIVKDGAVVAEIQSGDTFGESVLLIDGQRTATVRSKGAARVYGMEADDVRDVLRFQYEMAHKEVMAAVDKIIESENCDQIHKKLNAFQLHELYTDSKIQTFENGHCIFTQDQRQLTEVYVLVQGSVVLRKDDKDLQRVHSHEMFGIEGLLYGLLEMSAVVDGMAKCVVIGRPVLEEVFGKETMPTALLKAAVQERLGQVEELRRFHEEQLAALAGAFRIRGLPPGEEMDGKGVRLVMAVHHDVEVSTDNYTTDVRKLLGVNHQYVGMEQLLNPELEWKTQVRSCASDGVSWVAIWDIQDVTAAMARDEIKDKLSVLRMVLLFRTLPMQALQRLAQSMVTENFERNQAIFKQGDMGHTFYIVGSGRVHIERNGRFIRALGQGDYFGERALLTQEPRSASIIASENCIVWEITMETFQQVMPAAMIDYLKVRSTLQDKEFSFEDLAVSRTIGTGGFGVVKMVHTKDGTRYALKCVGKRRLVMNAQQETLVNERSILAEIDHPFIVKLVTSFRNEAFVYLLMELVSGGELLEALTHLGILNKSQAQFYTASILLALQYLHERRIAYLDLKSENILLDHQGYIKVVDFGLAVRIRGGQGHAVKGTPHFMAPEMILSKGYDTTADLWSLGICLYEFMVGELPFGNGITNKSEIFSAVLKAPLVFPDEFRRQPGYEESVSLIKSLLHRVPTKRLGGGIEGYTGLFTHVFFDDFDWDGLVTRKIKPPYVPKREHYVEVDNLQRTDSTASNGGADKRSLTDVEREAVLEELKDGWKDPEPGWDDDFEA